MNKPSSNSPANLNKQNKQDRYIYFICLGTALLWALYLLAKASYFVPAWVSWVIFYAALVVPLSSKFLAKKYWRKRNITNLFFVFLGSYITLMSIVQPSFYNTPAYKKYLAHLKSDEQENKQREQESKRRETKSNEERDERNREFNWMEVGKDAVKSKLKDPDSAEFQNVFFHRGEHNMPVTCGEVNSKNSFGGYGGYQKFISAGPKLTYLEEEVSDFDKVWNSFCLLYPQAKNGQKQEKED